MYIFCSVVLHRNVTIVYAGVMVIRKCAGTARGGGRGALAPLAGAYSSESIST